ncbi:hypothetical protein GLP31_13410 [Photobacterium carnosum]|uniref:hypothetical protein n=1 Tax=Photobacterium carnosum TaxID=2023717 RepID=UPI001E4F3377|nr:hypothetical protein [Photobacterium carnosum]MCD9553479.1 hypothetical protein [Photobacterium carnosum]
MLKYGEIPNEFTPRYCKVKGEHGCYPVINYDADKVTITRWYGEDNIRINRVCFLTDSQANIYEKRVTQVTSVNNLYRQLGCGELIKTITINEKELSLSKAVLTDGMPVVLDNIYLISDLNNHWLTKTAILDYRSCHSDSNIAVNKRFAAFGKLDNLDSENPLIQVALAEAIYNLSIGDTIIIHDIFKSNEPIKYQITGNDGLKLICQKLNRQNKLLKKEETLSSILEPRSGYVPELFYNDRS